MVTEYPQQDISPSCWTSDVLGDLGGDIPLDIYLREVWEAGHQGTELGRKFPRQAEILGPLSAATNLCLVSGWHSGLPVEHSVEVELGAVREHVQLLRQLGVRAMVYGECGQLSGETSLDEPIPLSPPLSRISLAVYCHKLDTSVDLLLCDYGLQLAYHHHLMMLVEYDDELERFLSHVHDNVGLAFDTGHTFVIGVEIPCVLQRYGHRTRHLHPKDVRPQVLRYLYRKNLSLNEAVRAGLSTIPGDGCIDYALIPDFVWRSGCRGWLVTEAEQDLAMVSPLVTARRVYAWLTHHLSSPLPSEGYVV